jgi:uncharacterized protein (DUF1501 family)
MKTTTTMTTAPGPATPPQDGARCAGPRLSRRGFLLGLAAAATVGDVRLALADAPGEQRLVVVLLRGGMDGLSVVQAYGDPDFAGLRGALALPEPGREDGTLDLGGRYGLHPSLAKAHALYRANQMLVLHAVAGPGRSRSHFEAQDLLESGAAQRLSSGWLNRALSAMPRTGGRTYNGLSVGLDVPLLMRGPVMVQNYAPAGVMPVNDDLMARIETMLARDPAFGPAVARGREERRFAAAVLESDADDPDGEMMGGRQRRRRGGSLAAVGEAAGRLLASRDGPRVAALELGGWDTHAAQAGRLKPALATLDNGLDALRRGLGEAAWRQTAVLVITEFGRTARPNGSQGTDHGTAGAAFLAGGAVAGGRVVADWPGLGAGKLYEDRDLQPTTDLRAVAKGLLRDHLKLPAAAMEQAFPGSASVAPMGRLVRTG